MEIPNARSPGAQRGGAGVQEARLVAYLEKVDWLPPQESGGVQDALLQATWRAGDGAQV